MKRAPSSPLSLPPVIDVKDASKAFGTNPVLKKVTFSVPAEHSFVLMGRSGSGKSVLLKCLLNLLHADTGDLSLNGCHLAHASEKQHRACMQQTGVVFQGSALFDSLTVWENVAFSLLMPPRSMGTHLAKKRALSVMSKVGLATNVADKVPGELSGGMQRRVALARAILLKPRVLLLDEPTAGLDAIFSRLIAQLIQELRHALKATVLTITHDLRLAQTIGDTLGILYQGHLVAQGSAATIARHTHPEVKALLTP